METDQTIPSTPLESAPPIVSPGPQQRQRYPVLTLLACAACVVVFAGLLNEPNTNSWATLSKWGSYPADEIRRGAYWGFITSVFVHLEFWHVGFNVYWLYVLGSRLERAIGSVRWLVIFLGAAFISSGAEFAFTDGTGIGASGVVYALFGFMWISRKRFPAFAARLDQRTIAMFFIWLVGCLAMTLAKVWEVGNAAHFAGLLFGIGVGAWLLYQPWRRLITAGLALLLVISVVPLFWAPWSPGWTACQGVRSYMKRDYLSAIHWYERSLALGQDKAWCWQNIALAYYYAGDQSHYEQALQTLRSLDKTAAREVEAEIAPERK